MWRKSRQVSTFYHYTFRLVGFSFFALAILTALLVFGAAASSGARSTGTAG